jgi:hypothetical protein
MRSKLIKSSLVIFVPLMLADFPSKPTTLANPFMPHINPALGRFNFITFVA